VYAEALIEAHGEPDLSDPVHGRVGGEYTQPEFDAENFEPPTPRADIAPGSGVR
jgi:uronate dehydrogenase